MTMTFAVTIMPSAIVTSAADSGAGTLRYWTSNVPANTTITFDPALNGQTLSLLSTIGISKAMTIVGPGVSNFTIDGGGTVQLFLVSASTKMSGLTFNHGYTGAGGGAIRTTTAAVTLTIDSCVFSNHYTDAPGSGGAISGAGPLVVTNSTFTGNSTAGGGGPSGGAIYGTAATTLTGDTFSSNSTASYAGGAVAISPAAASLTVSNCSFSSNSSQLWGGAIYTRAPTAVTNSTFAGNTSSSGGAFFAYAASSLAFVTITTSTESAGGGAIYAQAVPISISNSIVSGNALADLAGTGSFTSGGYNLISSTGGASYVGGTGDLLGASAGLGTYANHGGTVPTINVAANGAGVNAIPPSACVDASGNPVATDARGSARPGDSNANCDIGAFERQSTDP